LRRSKIKHIELDIPYEDNHLLAVNKPAGMLVQGDQTGDKCLVDYAGEYLRVRYHKPGKAYVGLVHRLDRPVSGLVLLTKTSKALVRMHKIFLERAVQKCYWALISQPPPQESGTLIHWLKKHPGKNRTHCYYKESSGAKRSELSYKLKLAKEGKYLLEVFPLTGRPHQIRAQLSAMGCPIIGDLKYGYKGKGSLAIGLHAKSLRFEHPIKKEPLFIEARLPAGNLWQSFK
jgi:23S rRNA pseudouridine1911/1915/1917 synthase